MQSKIDTNVRVVETAERIFLSSGFHRVSMDDLARDLGMSKKTLYAHFRSKEELVEAVLRRRVEMVERALDGFMEKDASFPQKFLGLASYAQARMAEVSPVFIADIRRHAPACFHIVEEFRGRAIPRYFGRLLEEGVRSGHVRADLDQALLIRLLVTAIQGIVRPDVIAELKIHPQEAMTGILGIVFEGVLTPRGRRISRNKFLSS